MLYQEPGVDWYIYWVQTESRLHIRGYAYFYITGYIGAIMGDTWLLRQFEELPL